MLLVGGLSHERSPSCSKPGALHSATSRLINGSVHSTERDIRRHFDTPCSGPSGLQRDTPRHPVAQNRSVRATIGRTCSWGHAVSILAVHHSFKFRRKTRQISPTRFAMTQSAQLTRVIRAINEGDPKAAAELLPLVYTELRKLAARSWRRRPREIPSRQPPSSMRLTCVWSASKIPGWNGRGHFFGAAAQAMRQILVDQARRKTSAKHGGGRRRGSEAGDWELAIEPPEIDILALHEALERLEREEPRKARIEMLRYFAGD